MAKEPFLVHADKLHALDVVGRSASLREAAARLGLAPSSLSEKIQVLEGHYGRSLVERTSGALHLTPFGEELVLLAREPLRALARLAPGVAKEAPRSLRIGAYESLAIHTMPELTGSLLQLPGVLRVEVRTGRSPSLLSDVARGVVDIAVVVGVPDDDRLRAVVVAEDELTLVRPKTLAETEARRRVAEGRWVGLAPGRGGHPRFYRTFQNRAALTGAPLLACDSFEVVRAVALGSSLPALLPRRVALRGPREFAFLAVSPEASLTSRHSLVAACRHQSDSTSFETFVAKLRAVLAKKAHGGEGA